MLELLALDIQKRQTRLSEIRLRERRTTLLFSVYALALWAAYVALWYTNFVPNLSGHPRYSKFEKSVQVVPVFLGPVVYVPRRLLSTQALTRCATQNSIHTSHSSSMVYTDREC